MLVEVQRSSNKWKMHQGDFESRGRVPLTVDLPLSKALVRVGAVVQHKKFIVIVSILYVVDWEIFITIIITPQSLLPTGLQYCMCWKIERKLLFTSKVLTDTCNSKVYTDVCRCDALSAPLHCWSLQQNLQHPSSALSWQHHWTSVN